MLRKGWIALFALAVMAMTGFYTSARAAAPTVAESRTVVGDDWVAYPQLEGLEDEAIQQRINDDIITKAEILSHMVTLSTLSPGGWGLQVTYEAFLEGDALSVLVSARGTMPNGREGHRYTALSYDLQSGEPLTLDALFTDADAAVAWMEERAEATLSEELSGYLEYSDIVPLPAESFTLDADGITFYYPANQFSLLSGYSGACQFYYDELAEFINPEGILRRMGVEMAEYTDAEARAAIQEAVRAGRLPHVPVAIGDAMTEIVERYRLLREPDQYPGGRYFQLEAPMFRQVLVLSDALERGYENSQALGLQSMRGSLYGIQAGITTRERWREILGEPESTVVFSESLAYDYALPVGESDFYTFGSHQLRLHANADGVLHSIRISR